MLFFQGVDKTTYITHMCLPSAYAGENEIRAVCVHYDVCIEVFSCELGDCTVTSQRYGQSDKPCVQLCYIPIPHTDFAYYDVIVDRHAELQAIEEVYDSWRVNRIMQFKLDATINAAVTSGDVELNEAYGTWDATTGTLTPKS